MAEMFYSQSVYGNLTQHKSASLCFLLTVTFTPCVFSHSLNPPITLLFFLWVGSVFILDKTTSWQDVRITVHHCPKYEGVMQLCNICPPVTFIPEEKRAWRGREQSRALEMRQWCNTVWLWHALSRLYEKGGKKSKSEREKERVRVVEVDSDEDVHTERWASFLLQSIPKQQDDVTALNYPWCFAGKMNEVGHVEGVNEDTHALVFHLYSNHVEWFIHKAVHGRKKKDALTEGSSTSVLVVHQNKLKAFVSRFIYPLTPWV